MNLPCAVFRRFSIILLILCMLVQSPAGILVLHASGKNDAETFRILCLCSYDYSYATIPDQLSGIKDGLGNLSYDIKYEFMDSKAYYKTSDLKEFYSHLQYKIEQNEHYDLLILSDDNALHFWLRNRTRLFSDVPVVFLGINNLTDAKTAADIENVTGIAEVPDYIGNFEIMHQLFPDRHHVVAIVDGSITGRGEYAAFQKYSEEFPEFTYSWINTGDYSQNGLKEAFSSIDDDSLILYLDFLEDGDGNIYTDRSASMLISENAPDVPIFRVSSSNLGHGVLGGLIYSYYDAGQIAGEMAASILTGASADDLPLITESVTTPMFDQKVMDQYRLERSDLPAGAVIVNEHRSLQTIYRENQVVMNLLFALILMLIVIITVLVLENRKRNRIINQDYLTKMPNRLFINAKTQQTLSHKIPFGIIMMDVDHFKQINDTLGHAVGDELLISVGKRLKSLCSHQLLIARIGGDEFMALLLGDSVNHPEEICQDILTKLREPHHLSTGELHITASLGCALYPKDTDDPTRTHNYADAALYEVKECGRNGWRCFEPEYLKHLGGKGEA